MSAAAEPKHNQRIQSSAAENAAFPCTEAASRRLGMLINPYSWGVRHGFLSTLRTVLEESSPLIPRAYAWNPVTFASAMDQLAAKGVRVLLVVGGDGTVQGVVSALLQGHGPGIKALSLLRGGRSNVTAAWLGATGKMVTSLNRLSHWERHGWPQPQQQALPTLRVTWGQETSHGFLLLGGAMVNAVKACRAFREQTRLPVLDGKLGTAFWFSRELVRVALGGGVLQPHRVALLGLHPEKQNYTFMVATTLPNWPTHTKTTGMRVGWVSGRGVRLLIALAQALAGKDTGHHFGWINREQVGMSQLEQGYFLLDGEPVGSGKAGDILQVQAGPAVQFLQMTPSA